MSSKPGGVTNLGRVWKCDEKVIPWIAEQPAILSIRNVSTLMCIPGNGFVQSSEDNAA
jgi:hypothetical protein